jgi:hypothetical protein
MTRRGTGVVRTVAAAPRILQRLALKVIFYA